MSVDLKSLTFSIEHLDPVINYDWDERHHESDINEKYFIDNSRELGRGYNSIVRKCIERHTGKRFAVKSVLKKHVKQVDSAKKEATILAGLDHPNIVKVYESYEDSRTLHIVSDFCKGGELFSKVEAKAKKGKTYKEHEASKIIQQLLDAVAHCHEKNIVHRDIKLENMILTSKKNDATEIKLIDFGLSTKYDPTIDEPMTSKVGTPAYVAPEVLNGCYTNSCDVWSIGIVTYALLTGLAPFADSDDILSDEEVDFPAENWDGISESAKSFVRSLLQKDESRRPSLAEAAEHEWFKVSDELLKITSKQTQESIFQKMQKSIKFNLRKPRVHPH